MVSRPILLNRYLALVIIFWTIGVTGLFVKDAFRLKRAITDLAIAEARIHFNKDQAIRLWVSAHGGIYVPVTETTSPNPYLAFIPDRDILTPSGKQLTLMNPAHMARQIMDQYTELYGVKAHITSLAHVRSETAPDDWERTALLAFEKGGREIIEVSKIKGQEYLRLMQPIKTEAKCLKCHYERGHTVGENRGGVSVSIPMQPYFASLHGRIVDAFASFAILWIAGAAGLGFLANRLTRRLREREQAEASLRISQENYRILVDNSLTGIYVIQDDMIVFANTEFARIHGYALHEIIGMEALALIHADDRAAIAERIRRRHNEAPVSDVFQVRCLTRTGGTIWVQRRNCLTHYDGRPAILGNEIDITRRMLADAELAASKRQLQRLTNGLIELRETERRQFATEIHENIAQSLSAIKIRVESVLDDIGTFPSLHRCEPLRPIISDIQLTVADIRKMAARYRPMALDHLGIIKTLEWLCRQIVTSCPTLRIKKTIGISESQIPETVKIIIFRIVEQMLHGLSTQPKAAARITLKMIDERIVLVLSTNMSTAHLNSFSLHGYLQMDLAITALKSHVESFGGTFRVTSAPSRWTTVIASWAIYCPYERLRTRPNRDEAVAPGQSQPADRWQRSPEDSAGGCRLQQAL